MDAKNTQEAVVSCLKQNARAVFALFKKEVYSFSISPAFFALTIFFLLFTTFWTFNLQGFFQRDMADLRVFFASFPVAFIIIIPAITMRSWAEERKTGSVEMLITLPFSEWALVLSKYLASLAAMCVMLVLSVAVPLSVSMLGNFDLGVIVSQYIGALLLASSAVSLGLFLSSLCKNQTAAFLGTLVVLLFVMLVNQIPFTADLPKALNNIIQYVSLAFHFESFAKGLLDSRDAAYFIFTTFLFLFLNTRALLLRKWN